VLSPSPRIFTDTSPDAATLYARDEVISTSPIRLTEADGPSSVREIRFGTFVRRKRLRFLPGAERGT
jgi:hypothetical protein